MGQCPRSIHCFRLAGHDGGCRDQGTTADGFYLDTMHLRLGIRDDEELLFLKCPGCGFWGEVDDDQLHGRVSLHHDTPACGYHETHDFWQMYAGGS